LFVIPKDWGKLARLEIASSDIGRVNYRPFQFRKVN
jgi:hypothetical protein